MHRRKVFNALSLSAALDSTTYFVEATPKRTHSRLRPEPFNFCMMCNLDSSRDGPKTWLMFLPQFWTPAESCWAVDLPAFKPRAVSTKTVQSLAARSSMEQSCGKECNAKIHRVHWKTQHATPPAYVHARQIRIKRAQARRL